MHGPGEPDTLSLETWPEPVAGPGQVLVQVAFAGVNFMDNGVRRGQFWSDQQNPKILGVEGAGRVIAVGAGVDTWEIGQRVAWAYAPGSYAERIAIDAGALVPVPVEVDDRTAAAIMMQGLTALHFATHFHPVQPGEVALVHGASGGVGQLLCQLVKLRGGTVIGRVSRAEKASVATAAGADHVIIDDGRHFADEVLRLTDGDGVHVVFDGSGAATFDGSITSLRRTGTLCWYGPGLDMPAPIELYALPKSIKLGYAAYYDLVPTPALLRRHAQSLFDMVIDGRLRVHIGEIYPLAHAARAHGDMGSRHHVGKLLLSA